MSTTSATPPATRRIARSYLTDLVAATPVGGNLPVGPVVEQLLEHAKVRHVLRSDQLVLTFDLADDPAGWSTPGAAADSEAHTVPAADPGQPTYGDGQYRVEPLQVD